MLLGQIFLSIGIFQGLITGAVLIRLSRKKYEHYLYLGYMMLIVSMSNLNILFSLTGLYVDYPMLLHLPLTFDLCIPPLLYLFVNAFLQKQNLTKRKLITYFSPILVNIFFHLSRYYRPKFELFGLEINFHFFMFYVLGLAVTLSLSFFLIKMRNSLKDFIEDNPEFSGKKEDDYLKTIIYSGYLLTLIYVTTWLTHIDSPKVSDFILFLSVYSILIYAIGLYTLMKKDQLNINHGKHKIDTTFIKVLDQFFKVEENYINPDISLKSISDKLQTTPQNLSFQINSHYKKNFNDFINSLRIEKSKEFLSNEKYSSLTILAIAYDSGFKSKSSFNAAFKKFIGMTPSEYKKKFKNHV